MYGCAKPIERLFPSRAPCFQGAKVRLLYIEIIATTVVVLQYDRTSVPLPPNLYLLNQNQKFMKRTLHLTVMMLLAIIASVNRAYSQEQVHVVNSVAEAKLLNDGDSV